MVGHTTIRLKKRKTNWLTDLLRSKFYDTCVDHHNLRKNDKNVFCIHCSLCLCRHCISSSDHRLHTWVQICKYVYHDVVRLQDIQKHIDCSEIQTYKINGEKAIHLHPRPQAKESTAKPSTKPKSGAPCETCGRYIQEIPNRFCSIACKVTLNENSVPQINMIKDENDIVRSQTPEKKNMHVCSSLKPRKKLNKRKGVPRRAPFF